MVGKPFWWRLVRWWWLIAASVLVAAFSSYAVATEEAPLYQTNLTLMIGRYLNKPNPSGGELGLAQQLAQAYAEIAQRRSVRAATMEALGLYGLPPYTVAPVSNTHLLEITVVDTDPVRAQAVANELGKQLIALSPTGSEDQESARQAFVAQQLDALQASITETGRQIEAAETELSVMTSARQIADTQAQITGLEQKQATEQANYAALLASTTSGATNAITVFEPALLPSAPISSGRLSDVATAAAIGLMVAVGGVYLLEYLDDTLKEPEDVRATLKLATLGAVPRPKRHRKRKKGGPGEQDVAVKEAFRVLGNNLRFFGREKPLRRVLVTSAGPSDSRSLVSTGLARALALAGSRVVMVDADMRRPRLHQLFSLDNTAGLSTALAEESFAVARLVRQTEVAGLSVLTSGPMSLVSESWLESDRMRELLAALDGTADYVILDAPPANPVADALVLAPECDGVLLVLDAGRTRRGPAQRALAAMAQVGAAVLGVVICGVPHGKSGY